MQIFLGGPKLKWLKMLSPKPFFCTAILKRRCVFLYFNYFIEIIDLA